MGDILGILFFEIFGCFIVVVIVWVGVVCGVCVGFFFFFGQMASGSSSCVWKFSTLESLAERAEPTSHYPH